MSAVISDELDASVPSAEAVHIASTYPKRK